MKILAVALVLAVVDAQYHIRCSPDIGNTCGDASRPRNINCCDHGYCQPWNSGYYQCVETPTKCPNQETDVDYYGNDLQTIYGLKPAECCDKCSTTTNCAAYTFVNENPDGKTACYLKTSAAGWREKKGAVSAQVQNAPATTCGTAEINVDYYGNDLKALEGVSEADCCAACSTTTDCRYYSYVVADKKCYLKYSSAGRVAKSGVISVQSRTPGPMKSCAVTAFDIDYYGNDIVSYRDIKYSECCDKCTTTAGCSALTFLDDAGDGKSGCYLKSSIAGFTYKHGATSSSLDCHTATGQSCGSEAKGAYCCMGTDFCQPWTPTFYQCLPALDSTKCFNVQTGIDFYGNDIRTEKDLSPAGCCDACSKEPRCKYFTFVNSNPDGHSACYLKYDLGESKKLAGAISGMKATH